VTPGRQGGRVSGGEMRHGVSLANLGGLSIDGQRSAVEGGDLISFAVSPAG